MKILFIGAKKFPNSREGGIDIVVEKLALKMAELGHDVTVLVRKRKNQIVPKEYKGVKIVQIFTINKKATDALVYSYFATKYARKHKFDVVHYHAEGNTFFINKTKNIDAKVITTIHGIDWKRAKFKGLGTKILLKSERKIVKYSDKVITLCKNDSDYFKDAYNLATNIIPNGFDAKVKVLQPNLIKEKFNLDKNSYVLFLARIVPEKGLHYLISAFNQLDKRREIKLVVAGGNSHSVNYYNEMVELAKTNSNILFTGFVSGDMLSELYSNALFYVLPSDIEGMPLSLLEALSFKKVCLCSDINELKNVNSKNCYYFKQGDVANLKEKLESLIVNTPEFIEENAFLSWDDVTLETLEIYESN